MARGCGVCTVALLVAYYLRALAMGACVAAAADPPSTPATLTFAGTGERIIKHCQPEVYYKALLGLAREEPEVARFGAGERDHGGLLA